MAVSVRSSSKLVYNASRTNSTITAPSGITDGDLLLLVFSVFKNAPAGTASAPSGFSAVTGYPKYDGNGWNTYVWYKVASGESGDYATTHSALPSQGFMYAISGASSTLIASTPGQGYTSSSTATGITTSADNSLVVFYATSWGNYNAAGYTVSGTTPTFTYRFAETGDSSQMTVQDGFLASAGSTGDKTLVQPSTAAWTSGLIGVSPATATYVPRMGLMGVG